MFNQEILIIVSKKENNRNNKKRKDALINIYNVCNTKTFSYCLYMPCINFLHKIIHIEIWVNILTKVTVVNDISSCQACLRLWFFYRLGNLCLVYNWYSGEGWGCPCESIVRKRMFLWRSRSRRGIRNIKRSYLIGILLLICPGSGRNPCACILSDTNNATNRVSFTP